MDNPLRDGPPAGIPTDLDVHTRQDPHYRARGLSEVILGGQDGLVNVLGVVLGVAAATSETRIVLAAGLAAAFAESVSMAAVAYTSTVANANLYESERARELRHVLRVPTLEREEVREIYRRKGFEGDWIRGQPSRLSRPRTSATAARWHAARMVDRSTE